MNDLSPNSYIEVQLNVPRNLADAISNYIIENICSGLVLEEEEQSDQTGIKFYVSSNSDLDFEGPFKKYLSELSGGDTPDHPEIRKRTIKNIEWIDAYRQSVVAIRVGDDVIIRPPWEAKPDDVQYDIVIEPKMAFGTGRHETTRSCLRVVRNEVKGAGRFLDLGCGSGILSILADQMGVTYIKAIDTDLAAIDNARENFEKNKVSAKHDILFGSTEKCADDEPYDYIVANIIKSVLLPRIEIFAKLLSARGSLILSGLLEADLPDIQAELKSNGLSDYHAVRDNDWFTLVIRRN